MQKAVPIELDLKGQKSSISTKLLKGAIPQVSLSIKKALYPSKEAYLTAEKKFYNFYFGIYFKSNPKKVQECRVSARIATKRHILRLFEDRRVHDTVKKAKLSLRSRAERKTGRSWADIVTGKLVAQESAPEPELVSKLSAQLAEITEKYTQSMEANEQLIKNSTDPEILIKLSKKLNELVNENAELRKEISEIKEKVAKPVIPVNPEVFNKFTRKASFIRVDGTIDKFHPLLPKEHLIQNISAVSQRERFYVMTKLERVQSDIIKKASTKHNLPVVTKFSVKQNELEYTVVRLSP